MSVVNELRYDCRCTDSVKVSLSSIIPSVIYTQVLVQTRVMRLEILNQAFFRCRVHLWRPGRIESFILFLLLFETNAWDIDKFEHLLKSSRRISIEIFTSENEH